MSLLFTHLCDLLSTLEGYSGKDPPLLPTVLQKRYREAIKSWFASHISGHDIDPVPLLSTLFPHKRTDRVYNIQVKRLSSILKRCFGLGVQRQALLDQWETPGRGDLSDCVRRVLQQAEFPQPAAKYRVSVEEIDAALAATAQKSRFSGPRVREREVQTSSVLLNALENIYRRLQSREAQWLTRLILKDFSCLDLDKYRSLIYSCIDPRLCDAMRVYDNFEDAVKEVNQKRGTATGGAGQPNPIQGRVNDAPHFQPKVGIKVPTPRWVKAKGGINNAVSMIAGKTMSIERKHDGEYCQIHIDLSKGEDCVQIFSKSGKDSTLDRVGIHQAIKDSLRVGKDDCSFFGKCILEGELLIWSDETNDILEFHKIRKHVRRSGISIGTNKDSQPHPWEHQMIMFYDVLLLDDDAVLHNAYTERRRLLRRLITPVDGRAAVVSQQTVSFSSPRGPELLKKTLAEAFALRWEGLVLKPSNGPYFGVAKARQGEYPSPWIKLKKDCISGLGDTADFAVIGAGYDATQAARMRIPGIHWTHFFIGCLRNKSAVLSLDAKPDFLVVDCVADCIKREDLRTLNQHGQFRKLAVKHPDVVKICDLEMASMDQKLPKMQVIFKRPFVFEIAGSGFEKESNRDIFTLRFPRVLKIHSDRDWKDAVDLEELQELAKEARQVKHGDLQEEVAAWIEKLDKTANGAKAGWDCCGNEDDYESVYGTSASPISTKKSPTAPPLVRMDTCEMLPNEHRLSNGQVTERPTSNHSTTSEGSLPTPPTSSLSSGCGGNPGRPKKRKFQVESPKARKRASKCPEQIKIYSGTEAIRKDAEQTKSSPNLATVDLLRNGPLHQVINSARPSSSLQSTQFVHQPCHTVATPFSLVPKVPLDTDDRTEHRHSKRRKVTLPPSQTTETTSDQCTVAPDTQDTMNHAPLPARTAKSQPTTPASTGDDVPISTGVDLSTVNLPNIQTCQIMLDPHLPAECPALLPLLQQHSINPILLPPLPTSSSSNNNNHPRRKYPPHQTPQTLLLVEPENKLPSSVALGALIHHLITSPPTAPNTMEMWDWHLLELVDTVTGRQVGSRQEVEDMFYARVRRGVFDRVSGDEVVEVAWRDGWMDVVGREVLARMRSGVVGDSLVGVQE